MAYAYINGNKICSSMSNAEDIVCGESTVKDEIDSLKEEVSELNAKLGVDAISIVSTLPDDASDHPNTMYIVVKE